MSVFCVAAINSITSPYLIQSYDGKVSPRAFSLEATNARPVVAPAFWKSYLYLGRKWRSREFVPLMGNHLMEQEEANTECSSSVCPHSLLAVSQTNGSKGKVTVKYFQRLFASHHMILQGVTVAGLSTDEGVRKHECITWQFNARQIWSRG